jgi:alpha-2-macroglobulin
VEVKKDAEYVMINVPIPAGCSYALKNQSRSNGEVHREYDMHEVRIYCEKLKAGRYEYKLSLVPRYWGKYHVNPAKVEWMYFPVMFGRTGAKKVTIK